MPPWLFSGVSDRTPVAPGPADDGLSPRYPEGSTFASCSSCSVVLGIGFVLGCSIFLLRDAFQTVCPLGELSHLAGCLCSTFDLTAVCRLAIRYTSGDRRSIR